MKEAEKPCAGDKFCSITKLKVFLLSLSLAFVGKTMSGAYMNSMYTQIEKQFYILASLVGSLMEALKLIVVMGLLKTSDPLSHAELHGRNILTKCLQLAGYMHWIFFGGLFMKKFKLNTYQAANIAFWVSLLEYLLYFATYWTVCDTSPVAGLTISYEGIEQVSYAENTLLAGCNRDCDCLLKIWDPVCGNNEITYGSSCLAGCKGSRRTGKSLVFKNCTCVAASGFSSQNVSATLGQCDGEENCDNVYIKAGIPSPIYVGALIDTTSLKWGTMSCSEGGACRMYDIVAYRWLYLSLPAVLHGVSYIPSVLVLLILKKKFKSESQVLLNAR